MCKFQHLPLTAVVSDSASAAVRLQTAVRPWRRELKRDIRDRRQSIDRECELIMAVRAASLLYSGDARVARLVISPAVGRRYALRYRRTFLSSGRC